MYLYSCVRKVRYESKEAARAASIAVGGGVKPYRCEDHWHIGHRTQEDRKIYGVQGGVPTDDDWELLRQLRERAE